MPRDDPGGVQRSGPAGPRRAAPDPPVRPRISDPDERDDARQILTVLLAAVQRERARADQFYLRSRNILTFVSAAFVAAQAALLANVGREISGVRLVSAGELKTIGWIAAGALLFVVITGAVVFGRADRARPGQATSGKDLLKQWMAPEEADAKLSVLAMLVTKVAGEEMAWASGNEDRGRHARTAARAAAVAVLLILAELVALFLALK